MEFGKTISRGLVAGTLIFGGCTSPEELEEHKILSEHSLAAKTIVDLCSENNPYLGEYNAPESFLDSLTAEINAFDQDPNQDSEEYIDRINSLVEQEYGFRFLIAEFDIEYGDFYAYSFRNNNALSANDALDAVHVFAKGFAAYPSELIRALGLSDIVIASHIEDRARTDPNTREPEIYSGFYEDGNIFLAYNPEIPLENESTAVHELTHAVDDILFCGTDARGDEDTMLDFALREFNTVPYNYCNAEAEVNDHLTFPNLSREFVRDYGACNPLEDRATILEWTMVERGLIQDGDPDYLSPLHGKQQELVRRLEEVVPGITRYLQARTLEIRNRSFETGAGELNQVIDYEHLPGGVASINETLEEIVRMGYSVETLVSGAIIHEQADGQRMTISNPALLRNSSGKITMALWSENGAPRIRYIDAHTVRILTSETEPLLQEVVLEYQQTSVMEQNEVHTDIFIGGSTAFVEYEPSTIDIAPTLPYEHNLFDL